MVDASVPVENDPGIKEPMSIVYSWIMEVQSGK
ncbi:hypothetical protein QG37_00239 [Candidozyma auris]|nr:hypothetical protein QG37_00239 [[Candida] auris]